MSEDNRPNELLHAVQDIWRAPQLFMPSARFAQTLSEASRGLVEAQVAYAQAIMGVNVKVMEAIFDRSEAPDGEHPAVESLTA